MLGLSESLETLNRRLVDRYGLADGLNPNWRVVWADNNLIEKRYGTFSKFDLHGNKVGEDVGVELRPKYNYIHDRYVLERFTWVPEGVESDVVEKYYYYPTWTFEDKYKNPLPADWEAIEIIIETVMAKVAAAANKTYRPKYKQSNEEYTVEQLKRRIKIMEELFGNETSIGDALAYKDGISMAGLDGKTKH